MTMPSTENMKGAWAAADEEESFWQGHYQEFLEQYPEQLVAVHDGKVVAAGLDLQEILSTIRDMGLDPTDVWVRFITADSRHMLL